MRERGRYISSLVGVYCERFRLGLLLREQKSTRSSCRYSLVCSLPILWFVALYCWRGSFASRNDACQCVPAGLLCFSFANSLLTRKSSISEVSE